MTLFLLVFSLAFFALVLQNRIAGLQTIVALLPLYIVRFNIVAIPMTLLELMIVIVISVGIADLVRSPEIRKQFMNAWKTHNTFFAFVILFMAAGTIAITVAPDTLAALGIWKAYIIEPVLLFGVWFLWVRTHAQLRRMLYALIIAASVVAIYGLVQLGFPSLIPDPWNDPELLRVTSVFAYPNALGLYLGPILVLTLGVIWKDIFHLKKRRRWLVSAAALMAGAIVFSESQGAMAGVLTAIFAWGLCTKWTKWWILAAIVVAGIILLNNEAYEAVWPIISFTDVSGEVRRVLWIGSWRVIADHWFAGVGLSGFPTAYDIYREARHTELLQYPHNIMMNFWVETGILGVISVTGYVAAAFATIKKHWSHPLAVVGFGMLIATLTHGMVDVPFFKNDLSVLWWIMFFIAIAGPKLTNNARD